MGLGLLELQQRNMTMCREMLVSYAANATIGMLCIYLFEKGFLHPEENLQPLALGVFTLAAALSAPRLIYTLFHGLRDMMLLLGRERLFHDLLNSRWLLVFQLFVLFLVIRSETPEVTAKMTLGSLLCLALAAYPGYRLTQIYNLRKQGKM